MKRKSVLLASALCAVLIVLLAFLGRSSCIASGPFAERVLYDGDREVLFVLSKDGTARYWIEGEEETAGCNWHLVHVECRRGGCLFRCLETEALWLLSPSGDGVRMEKRVEGSTLSQTYFFCPSSLGNRSNQ